MPVVAAHDANGVLIYFEVAGTGTQLDPYKTLHSDVALQELLDLLLQRFPVALIDGKLAVNIDDVSISNFPTLPTTQQINGSVEVSNFPSQVDEIAVSNLPEIQTIDGSVAVNNLPSVQQVSVGNFPLTQTVTVSNFPTPAQPPTTQAIAGVVAVSNFPASPTTQAVTGVFYPATQPISGSVAVSNFPVSVTDGATSTKQDEQIAKLIQLLEKFPTQLLKDRIKTDSLVRSVSRKFREDFAGTQLNPAAWTVMQTGAGQSISVTNSELRITSGVTPNSETIIRSVEKFTISFRTWFIANLSQRIINQEFYLEIVDASGGHYASWLFDGTNATGAKHLAANTGNSLGAVATAVTPSSGYQIFEIEAFLDEINWFIRAFDSNLARNNQSSTRTRQIPDPNLEYYVQIRVKNLATAPASSTTLNIDAITVQDIEELTTEITGGRGGINANQAIPTSVINAIAVSGSVTVGDLSTPATELGTPLAANVLGTGTAKDTNNAKNSLRGWVFTDVAGTLILEHSFDNTTFRQTHSIAIPGGTSATPFEIKLLGRYYKYKYQNGASAQTVFQIVSTSFNIGA